MKGLVLVKSCFYWANKHLGLISSIWIALFTSVTTYICYSSPFPIPEEHLGINSRNAFTALISGRFPGSREMVNETTLISIVDFPVQLLLESIGIDGHANYLLKLCLRSTVAALILLGLLWSLTKNYFASVISVTTVSSTFFWISSIQYIPKITSITLFAGGLWLMRFNCVSTLKRMLLAIGLAVGTSGVLANLSNTIFALLFLPIGISLLTFVDKSAIRLSVNRALRISLVFLLVWSLPIWLGYLRGGSLTGILNYSDTLDYSLIKSAGIIPSILGSGYWAETISLGQVKVYGWVPNMTDFIFSIRLVLLLSALLLCRIIVSYSNRIESRHHNFVTWSFALWLLSLISVSLDAIDWPLNLLVGKHSFAIAFRDPWMKLMPMYLVALALFMASVLSHNEILKNSRRLPSWILRAPRNLMLLSFCLFLLGLVQTRSSWQKMTTDQVNQPQRWMLYDSDILSEYISSVKSIAALAEDHSVCVDFTPEVGDSLRRDFIAITRIYSKKEVALSWSVLSGKIPASETRTGCLSRSMTDRSNYDRLILFIPPGLTPENYPDYNPFDECRLEAESPHLMVFDFDCVSSKPIVWPSEIATD
jgi:hypothetical protein